VANYALCARDIMQVEIATILGDASIIEATRLMLQEGVRSLLVEPRTEEDTYAIVTYSDIVKKVLADGLDPNEVEVHEVMTKPVVSIPPDMKAEYIARLFRQTKIGHAPVMDCGKLLGVVSMTDIVTEVIVDPD
jgi:CBS domain-containing protein